MSQIVALVVEWVLLAAVAVGLIGGIVLLLVGGGRRRRAEAAANADPDAMLGLQQHSGAGYPR